MAYYGSVRNVEVLASTWTEKGHFTNEDIYDVYYVPTTPTLDGVETFMEQVSRSMDAALAGEGFVVPIENASVISAISGIVEGIVADLVHYSHRSGRFFTKRALEYGISPMRSIDKELADYASRKSNSFRVMGAATVVNAVGDTQAGFDIL